MKTTSAHRDSSRPFRTTDQPDRTRKWDEHDEPIQGHPIGPGEVGVEALHGIIAHPDLELVGVRVYSEAKEGRDAGELCSVEPVGVTATRNVDKLLTLGADCVCFNASDHFGIDDMVEEICRILRAGVNVSNGSATALA